MEPPQKLSNPYEQLYGKALTKAQLSEMKYNLTRYVELLILLDKQHSDWIKANKLAKPMIKEVKTP